jgi:hypothetical protein
MNDGSVSCGSYVVLEAVTKLVCIGDTGGLVEELFGV